MAEEFPRSRISRSLARALPPPLSSLTLALDLATSTFDRSIPLLDRWNLVSTAVRVAARVASTPLLPLQVKDALRASPRELEPTGICERFKKDFTYDVCGDGFVRGLVKLVDAVEDGEVPVTDRLVEDVAQAVIVFLAPVLDVAARAIQRFAEIPGEQ